MAAYAAQALLKQYCFLGADGGFEQGLTGQITCFSQHALPVGVFAKHGP